MRRHWSQAVGRRGRGRERLSRIVTRDDRERDVPLVLRLRLAEATLRREDPRADAGLPSSSLSSGVVFGGDIVRDEVG